MSNNLTMLPDASEELLMNLIGESIIDNLTEDWHSAVLTFRIKDDGIYEAEIKYEDAKGKFYPIKILQSQNQILNAFIELRSRMQVKNYALWNLAIFTLNHKGEVSVDFKYPNKN